jgi:hypothetical protein
MIGKVLLLIRLISGVVANSGRVTVDIALSIFRSASFMSSPNSNVAIVTELELEELDVTVLIPSTESIAVSIGRVISLSMVSGLEFG